MRVNLGVHHEADREEAEHVRVEAVGAAAEARESVQNVANAPFDRRSCDQPDPRGRSLRSSFIRTLTGALSASLSPRRGRPRQPRPLPRRSGACSSKRSVLLAEGALLALAAALLARVAAKAGRLLGRGPRARHRRSPRVPGHRGARAVLEAVAQLLAIAVRRHLALGVGVVLPRRLGRADLPANVCRRGLPKPANLLAVVPRAPGRDRGVAANHRAKGRRAGQDEQRRFLELEIPEPILERGLAPDPVPGLLGVVTVDTSGIHRRAQRLHAAPPDPLHLLEAHAHVRLVQHRPDCVAVPTAQPLDRGR
eukprot:16452360-Heterocapsa_arctica.AAC.2